MQFARFSHDGKTYLNSTSEGLLEAGVPQSAIDAHLAGVRLAAIKAECRRRIYAIASAETQMNMATAASVVAAKVTSARSADDVAILAGTTAALGWVSAMRAKIALLYADASADLLADANWPACPQEALDLVNRF